MLDNLPERVGSQRNPLLDLGVSLNPSGAYLATLTGDWQAFYEGKRSSATRRRDHTKRKRLRESGEVRMVTPQAADAVAHNLATLIAQKERALARMGVVNMFERLGYRAFYTALAGFAPRLVHISRLTSARCRRRPISGSCSAAAIITWSQATTRDRCRASGPGAAHLHELMRYGTTIGWMMPRV